MGVRGGMGRLGRGPPRERPGLTIGNGMGRYGNQPSNPRVLGNSSPLQTCALWLVHATVNTRPLSELEWQYSEGLHVSRM